MLEEFQKEIKEILLKQRPEKIEKIQYGQYGQRTVELLYDDSEKKYTQLVSYPENKKVGSAKAFAACIREELIRRNNMTGEKGTVRIFSSGGYFIPDEDFGVFRTTYERINSQQWNFIKARINKNMTHREFLEFVQALKPSIEDFDLLFAKFSSLRMIGNSTLASTPVFINGESGKGYKCTYKLESGYEGEELLPSAFVCEVPFVKAGERTYFIPIEILFYRDDDEELGIRVMCPTFENIEEKAIIDEADYIKKETNEFSKLLVLSDF